MSAAKKTPAAKKQGNLIYLGPTITGVVRHSTIFKNGVLPQKLNKCVEEFPAMKKLLVSMDEISKVTKELMKEQSAVATIYAQVDKKFNKK